MVDLLHFLTSAAWAQTTGGADATSAAHAPGAELFGPQALVFLVILGIFYFLLIRPQQQKQNQHTAMLKQLQKGEKIVTGGGVIATIYKLDNDEYLTVEIAENVRVKILRSTIVGPVEKATAVVTDDKKSPAKS